jgi:hypothetical protein
MFWWRILGSLSGLLLALPARSRDMTWRDALEPYLGHDPALFEKMFASRRADRPWQPVDDDRTAAAKMHIQLVSRIATQPLGYLAGDERTALTSVYNLFEKARDISTAHPKAHLFEAVIWHVMNERVRPFTAKWHGKSERGALVALDATDEFRAELKALRPVLARLDDLLLFIRDGVAAPRARPGRPEPAPVAVEMDGPLTGGINRRFSGFSDKSQDQVDEINLAERKAIDARRLHYHITDPGHFTGLAISGGGIRSATFSLGVLVALAQRNLLPQFDYLSTVSGGGYLGAFLSAFLRSSADAVGLGRSDLPFRRDEGEAAALRHIRHHSKYLAVGGLLERLEMLGAQLYGVALNLLAVLWIAALAVVAERWARDSLTGSQIALDRSIIALALAAAVSLLALRMAGMFRGVDLRKWADRIVLVPAVSVLAAVAWQALDWLHVWFATPLAVSPWLGNKKLWLGIVGAIPVLRPALDAFFPRLLKRSGIVFAVLTALAAPMFLLGLYLWLYQNPAWLYDVNGIVTWPARALGLTLQPWVVVATVGLVVYVFLFDINATSPHRHYRRKLAQAYLIQPKAGSTNTFEEDVRQNLSGLGHKGPYHLINCALNVPASKNIAMQGRLTDFFLFSKAYCGSPLIGYHPTSQWEAKDARLDLGTAMAISGAAAAPQMGTHTIKRFSFWLALLNVRLGHWVRRPGVGAFPGPPGLRHLFKEMFGWMNETSPWLNLTDGGHIENLGVYELLRRRCKYIVAIDGEEDPAMTFQGLATLQRLAAIDLGVRIDADLDDLRLTGAGLSRSHFRFCRIRYPRGNRDSDDEFGYLVYVKLSLTGNEGEFIRRYRLDEPAFPHDSTLDQFFSEAQFEAYRSLGEHVGNKLFLRAVVDDLAEAKRVDLGEWFRTMGQNLLDSTTRVRS